MKGKKVKHIPNVNDLTILELAPYIKGEQKLEVEYSKPKLKEDQFQEFWNKLNMNNTYKTLLECSQFYKDYFQVCYDLAKMFDRELHSELFYAAKVGYFYEGVPTYLVYMIKECLKEYPFGNLLIKRIPTPLLNQYFREGALGNVSLYDIIAKELGTSYQVIDKGHLYSEYETYAELYIPNEDMVAIVPNDLIQSLTTDYIESLSMYEDGLASADGVYLGKLGGYHGACNSYYDLRKLV